MRVLAIDPGTSMGWARILDGQVDAGVQTWKVRRGYPPGLKWAEFRRWLHHMSHTPSFTRQIPEESARVDYPEMWLDLLVVEAPIGKGQKSLASNRSALAWNTIAEEVAASYGINYLEVYPATVKKFATGNGLAPKTMMLELALAKWPDLWPADVEDLTRRLAPSDQSPLFDQSDALWLMQYATEEVKINYGKDTDN